MTTDWPDLNASAAEKLSELIEELGSRSVRLAQDNKLAREVCVEVYETLELVFAKSQQLKAENERLRLENVRLRAENEQLKVNSITFREV